MALVLNDRVKETTTSTGTGTVNLAGAETGFETFVAGVGNTNTTYYAIVHQSAAEFEVGLGTVSDSSPDTLSRTTILSSSNSDSAVNFSAGTKDVFCTLPASKAVHEDASGNVTLPGTLDVDGGITVDNITIDGTEIDLSSGSLTLDVADDIILDANGGSISLKDNGTEIGLFTLDNSGYFDIFSSVSDNDLRIRVNDGGVTIDALTFDGSDAGAASFNSNIKLPDNAKAIFGAGDDLQIFHTGSKSVVSDQGTGNLQLQGNDLQLVNADDTATYLYAVNGSFTKLYHNNSEKLATASGGVTVTGNISNTSGDLTLDVAGDIVLDADGADIHFKDGGTSNSRLGLDSAGLIITVEGADKDFFINGDDGGSAITAIRVDMSDAGALICNGNITAFGSPSDIRLKENIEVIPNALDKVKQLKGVTFNYKKDGKKSTGLIAQDLEKVLPEVVYETSTLDKDEEKHLAVRYGNTVGLLVEAIKELEARVKELEGK